MKAWEENPDPEASIDCCTVHVFSWGHAAGAVHHRRSAEYSFPKDAPPLPPSRQERNINPPFPEPPTICRDFSVKSAERPKRWTNADLWLSDTDCDWHMPLFFTLRDDPTGKEGQIKSCTLRQKGSPTHPTTGAGLRILKSVKTALAVYWTALAVPSSRTA